MVTLPNSFLARPHIWQFTKEQTLARDTKSDCNGLLVFRSRGKVTELPPTNGGRGNPHHLSKSFLVDAKPTSPSQNSLSKFRVHNTVLTDA